MKKLCLTLLAAAAVSMTAAEVKKDYSDYLKVASDLGTGPAVWTMTSGCITPTTKKLLLEVDPAEVKAAAIEYELKESAYDPKLKKHITQADHNWGDIYVVVNGKTVYSGHAGKYITPRGLHRMDIDPKVLKAGENTIMFVWKSHDNNKSLTYGYIYFSVDNTDREIARRKKPRKEWGNPHNDDIRIRLLIKL